MKILILSVISYFIGFLFLLKIRSYDIYEKEPLKKMILFSFIGGFVAIITASVLYTFIPAERNLFDAIFKIGVIEEGAKLFTIFVLYKIIKKDFDEIVDGIIYISAIALGFSIIENIMYANRAINPFSILTLRFLTATVGHIAFSVYLGIAFYIHKNIHKNYSGLLLAFSISILAHGLYDGFIFNKHLSALFIPVYVFIIYLEFRLLKVAYAYSKKKKFFLTNYLKSQPTKHDTYCCNCENTDVSRYHFLQGKIDACNNCNHLIIDYHSLDKILKYYRPKLNRKYFFREINSQGKSVLSDDFSIAYNGMKQQINTDPKAFSAWLSYENAKDLSFYHTTLEGRIFSILGFRYLKKMDLSQF